MSDGKYVLGGVEHAKDFFWPNPAQTGASDPTKRGRGGLGVTSLCLVRRGVRYFDSQPGTGKQALAEPGRPKASCSKGFRLKTLIEK